MSNSGHHLSGGSTQGKSQVARHKGMRRRHSAGVGPTPQHHIPGSKGGDWGNTHSVEKHPPFCHTLNNSRGNLLVEESPDLALQLVRDGEDGLQHRHEAGYLAEAAAARHLCMHREALLKASCIHTSGNFMEPSQDVGRELERD